MILHLLFKVCQSCRFISQQMLTLSVTCGLHEVQCSCSYVGTQKCEGIATYRMGSGVTNNDSLDPKHFHITSVLTTLGGEVGMAFHKYIFCMFSIFMSQLVLITCYGITVTQIKCFRIYMYMFWIC